MDEILPFTSFSFNPNPIISPAPPTPIYLAKEATDFEACNIKGIRKGVIIMMKQQMNGSPQGLGSKWVITNYRQDIDRITIQPLGSRAGRPIRNITLACFKQDFIPIGLFEYKIEC